MWGRVTNRPAPFHCAGISCVHVHAGAFEQQTLCRKKRGWKVLGTLESLFASTMHIDDSHLFTEYVAFSLLCLLNVAGLGNDACVS